MIYDRRNIINDGFISNSNYITSVFKDEVIYQQNRENNIIDFFNKNVKINEIVSICIDTTDLILIVSFKKKENFFEIEIETKNNNNNNLQLPFTINDKNNFINLKAFFENTIGFLSVHILLELENYIELKNKELEIINHIDLQNKNINKTTKKKVKL